MERCYKIIVSLLVLTYLLVPINQVLAMDVPQDGQDQGVPAVQAKSTTQQKREVISITSDELLLLSKLVAGEARGESYEGQVAVAAVVINRVRDSRFPTNNAIYFWNPDIATCQWIRTLDPYMRIGNHVFAK